MAGATELPQLVREFVDMSKEYVLQETVEPAKRLGRYTGFAVGAALCWALGVLFLAVAGNRLLIDVLPEGPNWSALGYLITTVVLVVVAAIIAGAAGRSSARKD